MLCRMRSNEIFARMTTEEAGCFLADLKREDGAAASLALDAAAAAFRLRPTFLRRQPLARQADWMRKALGRTIGAPVAEEVLASYFLEHRKAMLIELLDALGVKHEDGQLAEPDPKCPESDALASAIETFLAGEGGECRWLLVRAFAAQSSIQWPALEELIAKRAA
jgi:hypothetical protein